MTRRIIALLALAISGWLLLGSPMANANPDGAASPSTPKEGSSTGTDSGNSAGASDSGNSDGSTGKGGNTNPGTTVETGSGKAVPRLMLVAFGTDPATITAGNGFDVNLSLENKSKSERVSNVRVTVTAEGEGILPAGGAASTYIERIGAGGTAHRTLGFRTLASLEGRAYQMTVTIEYEDSQHNMLTATETVSVVVAQTNRASTSPPKLTPDELVLGMDGSLTFTVNNLGKNKLYNTRVAIAEGQGVAPTEVFVGNIESGATGNVEMTVTPTEEVLAPIELTITYEDANGEASTMNASFELITIAEPPIDPMPPVEEPTPKESGFPWWMMAGIALGVVALIVLVVVLVRRRNKASALQDDMSFLDGDTLLPNDHS